MKIQFNIDYQTNYGERLVLNVLSDDAIVISQYDMSTRDGYHWACELTKTVRAGCKIDYFYMLVRDETELRHEWPLSPHRLTMAVRGATCYQVYDHWMDIPENSWLYSSAFTECIVPHTMTSVPVTATSKAVVLRVHAPQLRSGERLAIVGAPVALGEWDADRAIHMTEQKQHEWVVCLDATQLPTEGFDFKFVILSDRSDVPPVWEDTPNHRLQLPKLKAHEVVTHELPQAWFPVAAWRGAGTVIPVFSLRSEGSFGVGDFGDLKMMIDWAAKTGQRIIQVLPINDTTMTHTWQDSYPYNAISIYALHPQFTDFRQLPELKNEQKRAHFEQLRQELNALPEIDYERVNNVKLDYLHELFVQEWAHVSSCGDYTRFFDENKEWLVPYAQFCVSRDTEGTTNFWYFVQYHLDCQMRGTHDYARLQHIILKGDIPIGISRDGVEAWAEPKYFNLNGQAGAPPDEFAADGQNWGFPTYNWDEMLRDGCQWWVRRFRKMQQYFDAYRIDHVLGFFRIWEIPVPETSGLMGQFAPALGLSREEIEGYGIYGHDDLFLVDHKRPDRWHPRIAVQFNEAYHRLNDWEKQQFNRLYNDYFYRRNNQFWYEEAMKKLPCLTQATRMLACAEDLGMVPDCVGWVMNELRILTLEIQSMPKDNTVRFGQLWRNPYRSVCTISTHDMPMLRQWWDENWERAQSYYNSVLWHDGPAPHPMPGWLARDIVCQHLASPSMLCLLSQQDWLATDETLRHPDPNSERINIPANSRHYWRWRMPLTLEQLMQADDFNDSIRDMITRSGRT